MRLLIRVLPLLFLVWLTCYTFYSMGKRNALKGSKRNSQDTNQRKKVDSKVVEKEKDEWGHNEHICEIYRFLRIVIVVLNNM